MFKNFLLSFIMSILIALPLHAANTTNVSGSFFSIEITGLDADWSWADDIVASSTISSKVKNAKIAAIAFYPSAANDRFIVHDGGIDEATFFDSGIVSASSDSRIMYYLPAKQANLVIDISDCTMGVAANCKIVIMLEP